MISASVSKGMGQTATAGGAAELERQIEFRGYIPASHKRCMLGIAWNAASIEPGSGSPNRVVGYERGDAMQEGAREGGMVDGMGRTGQGGEQRGEVRAEGDAGEHDPHWKV
jgi:hypothetical protein